MIIQNPFISTKTILAFLIMLFCFSNVHAQISGKVFHDFNNNSTLDNTTILKEVGVSGISVKAIDATGASATATTGATGAYTFPNSGVTASGKAVRIEFSGLPTGANFGKSGGTSVQFVTAGASTTNVDVALGYANDYCQTNPSLVTPCYVESSDPALDIVVKFSANNTGTAPMDKTAISVFSQVGGALWGMAYARMSKKIYAAAVLKAHVPLGPGGLDAIYMVDPTTGSSNGTPWVELTDDLGIAVSTITAAPQYHTNVARGVNLSPQNDANAFVDAGKVGIGDIELSADEKTLYVVNMFDKKLYAISTTTKQLTGTYAIPNPGCTSGQARPWAVGEYKGEIYVGVTCDGSASGVPSNLTDDSGVGNLSATVYKLSGSTFSQVLSVPLNYLREPPFQYSNNCNTINHWKPWVDVIPATCADGNVGYPTPVLSDIEFDDNGNMVLGFTDRTGYQFGYENYGLSGTTLYSIYAAGDMLRACKTTSGWSIESTASGCSSTEGLAIGTNDPVGYVMTWGDLAKPGEFYVGDFFHNDGNFDGTGLSYYPGHPENTLGGLTVIPNTGEVMTTAYDPVTGAPNYNTGGVTTLSNITGKRTKNGFQLYATEIGGVTQGKGVGFGDLEALCDPAPIEIGNRVWDDTDKDGIQDAGEPTLSGVTVKLYAADGTTLIGTATTNASGNYYFSSGVGTNSGSAIYSLALGYNTNYILQFPTTLSGKSLTTKDLDANDLADSDADTDGKISFTTGSAGENNHTFDVGYITCTQPTATASATQPSCTGTNAPDNGGITIAGFTAGQRYQYSSGTTFNSSSAIPASITAIPAGGVITSTLANTTSSYTVRIYDATVDGCFVDKTVNITAATCNTCTPPNAGADVAICLPKTTLNLTDAATGTEWVAVSGNPAAAVIDATTGVITGMTVVGTYKFRIQKTGDATCSDEMQVVVTAGEVPIVLCNDGSTSYTLLAQAGLTNVVWYNMAGVQVGTGASLIVKSTTTGLEDGTEAFYYVGQSGTATGCDVELCCPVKFLTQSCCPTPNCLSVTIIKN